MKNKEFLQGYACAVATIHSSGDVGSLAEEALQAAGLDSLDKLRKLKIDDYDIDVLTPLVLSINTKRRNNGKPKDELLKLA